MIRFYAFRINLIKPSDQSDIFNEIQNKEQYFYDVLDVLALTKKAKFSVRNSKLFIYHDKEIGPNITLYKLAKEEVLKTPKEGVDTIEIEPIISTPFIFIIIDRKRQVVLIQEKTTVFQQVESSRAKIEWFFNWRLRQFFITALLKPITDKYDFWEGVKKVDEVSEFQITFNGPNMFRGRHQAEEFVEEVYEDFNITEFTVKLKNKFGQLKLLKENLAGFISLVSAGAGKYILKAMKNGKPYTLQSDQFIKERVYKVNNPEDIDSELLEKDLNELDLSDDDDNG